MSSGIPVIIDGVKYDCIVDYFRCTVAWKEKHPDADAAVIYRIFLRYKAAVKNYTDVSAVLKAFIGEGFPRLPGRYIPLSMKDVGGVLQKIDNLDERCCFIQLFEKKHGDIYNARYETLLEELKVFKEKEIIPQTCRRLRSTGRIIAGKFITDEAFERLKTILSPDIRTAATDKHTFAKYCAANNINTSIMSCEEVIDLFELYLTKKKYRQHEGNGFKLFRDTLTTKEAENFTKFTRSRGLSVNRISYEDAHALYMVTKSKVTWSVLKVLDDVMYSRVFSVMMNMEQYLELCTLFEKSGRLSWDAFLESVNYRIKRERKSNKDFLNSPAVILEKATVVSKLSSKNQ